MKFPLFLLPLIFMQLSYAQEKNIAQPYYITPRTGDQHIDVEKDWQLGYADAPLPAISDIGKIDNWINVAQPTTVQIALHKAGKLPHPYYHLNAKQYEWVDKKVWYYRKQVSFDKVSLAGKYVFLYFDGLDYFAKIWVNGKLLGRHEGMFGGPGVEVGGLLKKDQPNEVVVELRSANYGQWDKFDYRVPGRIIKSIDQAGGEGSKPFFALGMWQKARFEIVPAIHLERPFLSTKSASAQKAVLAFDTEIFVRKHSLNYQLHPWNNQILSRGVMPAGVVHAPEKAQLKVTLSRGGRQVHQQTIPLALIEGRNWVKKEFVLSKPELWMPVGMGKPNTYQVKIALVENNAVLDEISFDHGIRTIRTVQTQGPRTSERWDDLQFIVNDQPIFVKGMNWMPADALLDLQPEKYRWLLSMAKAAGIQMIRVWGGGLIEKDDFYNTCDSLGIMVWQDFPIWHQDTPDRPQDIWEAQVVQNIFRLRNHPSLVLYCGGNGFNPYSSGSVISSGIMERNLNDLDPTRKFIRTSCDAGNVHTYPDIDPARYAHLYQYFPFVSESGIHSITNANELKEIITPAEFNDLGKIYGKDFPDAHPEIISHFVEYNAFRVPRMVSRASHIDDMKSPTIESMAEASQVGAGEFYQLMSEGLQSNYPVTSGLMPWVFKRPWPIFSAIMLVDGSGQPTASYYFLKRTYEPVHAALTLPYLLWAPNETISVKTALTYNANPLPVNGKITVSIYSDGWEKVWQKEVRSSIAAGTGVKKDSLGTFIIPEKFRDHFFYVVTEFKDMKGKMISRSVYWPRCLSALESAPVKTKLRSEPMNYDQLGAAWIPLEKGPWLKPTAAKVTTTLSMRVISSQVLDKNRSTVRLAIKNTGNVPAFMVQADIKGNKRAFYASDNFFLLAVNESREITVEIQQSAESKISEISLDAWNAEKITARLE